MRFKQMIQICVGLSFLFWMSACGGRIPNSYQGTYVEPVSGSVLVLEKDRGIYTDENGKTMQAPARSISYEDLGSQRGGVFLQMSPNDSNKMDVYWVIPGNNDRVTDVGGFRMIETGVIQTQLEVGRNSPVPMIEVKKSATAILLLDDRNHGVEVVVPEESDESRFIRRK